VERSGEREGEVIPVGGRLLGVLEQVDDEPIGRRF